MFDQINRYGGGAGAGFFMNAIYFFARVSGKLLPIIRQTFMRQSICAATSLQNFSIPAFGKFITSLST